MTKLSVLLLYYQETPEVCKPMLDSIECQKDIDWNEIEILICSSSLDAYELDLTNYPNIRNHSRRIKQDTFVSGPGASWRLGILNAQGKCVWKIDIDDTLYNEYVFFHILNRITEYNYPNFMYYSHEENGEIKNAFANAPYSMAPWAWVLNTEFLKENDILPHKYLVTKEDINFFGRLFGYANNSNIIKIKEVIYSHKDNPNGFTHGLNEDAYLVCKENYYYFMNNCEHFINKGLPIPLQVPLNFLWQWWIYVGRLKDDVGRFRYIINLTKIALTTYPEVLQSVWNNYKHNLQDYVYPYTLVIMFYENSTLEQFKECLNSIQNQTLNEDTYFDVSKLQLLCGGSIPNEIKEYDYSYEYPLLYNNLMFIERDDVNPFIIGKKTGVIPANFILKNNVELYNYFIKQGDNK